MAVPSAPKNIAPKTPKIDASSGSKGSPSNPRTPTFDQRRPAPPSTGNPKPQPTGAGKGTTSPKGSTTKPQAPHANGGRPTPPKTGNPKPQPRGADGRFQSTDPKKGNGRTTAPRPDTKRVTPPKVDGKARRPVPPPANTRTSRPTPPAIRATPGHAGRPRTKEYYRDVSNDVSVYRNTTIINNNHYYTPSYSYSPFHSYYGEYSAWNRGFFWGYLAGSINNSYFNNYYDDWGQTRVGSYWDMPQSVWYPHYNRVLLTPPLYVSYGYAESWQHPPLNKSSDPLEQLAFYGQLKKPWGGIFKARISAEEARARLHSGDKIYVAGVAVRSFEELAQIVPAMAEGKDVPLPGGKTARVSLPRAAREKVQEAITKQDTPDLNSMDLEERTDLLLAKLPPFSQVYSPRSLEAEEEVGGKKINRTMDAAQAIYQREEVREEIAEWWAKNPDANRDALNKEINQIVTEALTSDLGKNREAYANDPTLSSNPIEYLRSPQMQGAAEYNLAAIDKVRQAADKVLRENLISKAITTMQTEAQAAGEG